MRTYDLNTTLKVQQLKSYRLNIYIHTHTPNNNEKKKQLSKASLSIPNHNILN